MMSKVFLLLIVFCVTHAHPPGFDTKVEEVLFMQGSTASVWCNASGDEPMNYQWYTDDENEIFSNSSDSLYSNVTSKGAFLIFDPVGASHNRSYTCIATNVHGLRVKVFSIVVRENKGEPVFERWSARHTLKAGLLHQVLCNASGTEPIEYKWYTSSGKEIPVWDWNLFDHVYVQNFSEGAFLVFEPAGVNDTGNYYCTATNNYGHATRDFYILVPQTDNDGNEIEVNARIVGVTESSVKFFVDNYNVSTSLNISYQEVAEKVSRKLFVWLDLNINGTTFEIDNLIPSGRYSFWFQTNTNNNTQQFEAVLLPSEPEIILRSVKDDAVVLEWIRDSDYYYRNTIDKYSISYNSIRRGSERNWIPKNCTIQVNIPSCTYSRYTISGLSLKVYYEIRVQAHTEAGYGEPHKFKVLLS